MGVLYARVSGAWVPVVGADEVWVATDPPTDPGVELWYDTDDPGLGDMSKLPRGWVGQAIQTAAQAISTANTWTDLTGLSVTWTADPTRRYRTSLVFSMNAPGNSACNGFGGIYDGASNTQINGSASSAPIGGYMNFAPFYIESGLSGVTTRKGRFFCNATGGSIVVDNAQRYFPTLIVEDLGGV